MSLFSFIITKNDNFTTARKPKKVVTLSIKKAGTTFDLINVFSLVGKRVHNMQSIFVIGKGISKVKNCRYMEHKVEKFLNYIGKYYIERIEEDKHWIVKKNKSI